MTSRLPSAGETCETVIDVAMLRTMAAFALAVGVNSGSVAVQARWRLLTRLLGVRDWPAHLLLVAPGYAWFLLLAVRLNRERRWRLKTPRALGLPLLAVAVGMWLAAYRQLGPERTGNGYFFGRGSREPVRDGIYRWLRNPMYDAYALALAGVALCSQNAAYLLLAVEAVVLFNGVEASVENRPFVDDGDLSGRGARGAFPGATIRRA